MKRNLKWLFFVGTCVLCVTIGWTVNAQRAKTAQPPLGIPATPTTSTPKPQWEYKIVAESEKQDLNTLGVQGWELVTVTNGGAEEVYYFKRAR